MKKIARNFPGNSPVLPACALSLLRFGLSFKYFCHRMPDPDLWLVCIRHIGHGGSRGKERRMADAAAAAIDILFILRVVLQMVCQCLFHGLEIRLLTCEQPVSPGSLVEEPVQSAYVMQPGADALQH